MALAKDKKDIFDFQEWLNQRKQTTKFFYFQSLTLGMEYALTMMTLYLYLTDILKIKDVDAFYTAISTIYIMSQISFSIFGHLFDQYRNLKTMLFIGNVLVVIGNIFYTIPWSPWCLFFGRLVFGGGGFLRVIMTSELTRSYPEEELLPHFTIMGMSFALGFILGPVVNFAFVKADFSFFGIRNEYANGASLVLALVFILVQVIATFTVSNLSKEYDLKEKRMRSANVQSEQPLLFKITEDIPLSDGEETQKGRTKKNLSIFKTMKHLLKSLDAVLILFFSMLLMHCMTVYDLWEPMACVKFQKWGIFEINVLNLGYGVMAAIISVILVRKTPSNDSLVYLAMICMFCLTFCQMVYIIFKLLRPDNTTSIVLWVMYTFCFSISVLMEEVLLINAMACLAPSSVQAFCESVRLSASRTGAVLALSTAAYSFHYLQYICIGYLTISWIIMLLLLWRKRQFQNPKIIDIA
ncbi:uncharacterized protein [Clytia hemisphaerica]|uniref:uncharacterized protein n=1 Tax=Clytia hemisphaerica TaxID=252671 RepID=UPI0034D5464D